jgi:hypothetical protein
MVLAVVCGIYKVVGETLLVYDTVVISTPSHLAVRSANVRVLPSKSVNGFDKRRTRREEGGPAGQWDSVKKGATMNLIYQKSTLIDWDSDRGVLYRKGHPTANKSGNLPWCLVVRDLRP